MKLLLDTHILIWLIAGSEKLNKTARYAIEDENNSLYFSIASLWEITIKISLGKLELGISLEQIMTNFILPSGLKILPIHLSHLSVLKDLPFYHRDPFDRMLISQAISESLTLISEDELFGEYAVKTLW
jgi:Uncharacterized protein conserved in bacteria